ncbi:hypothetical protein RU07_17500 [Agrobacterium tumefaciens]|uniref:Uncharacterized protein n=1 Tax=Agrobacterium tumefaciens TaxID=358 RepID=A0A0D0KTM4_AGRTU|nr:hypothetical protein RU07_17500 [Agrobacterium tumefaciens]
MQAHDGALLQFILDEVIGQQAMAKATLDRADGAGAVSPSVPKRTKIVASWGINGHSVGDGMH